MAYELIPGVRQDHRGRFYQHGRYPNGKLIVVPVESVPLSDKTLVAFEPVMVESRSTLTLNKNKESTDSLNLPWAEAALQRGSLFKKGEVFRSLRCYQGASA